MSSGVAATAGTPARLRPGAAALLVAAVFVCFLPALGSQFVLWDDDMNFTDNPSYRGLSASHLRWMFTTLYGGHYQPLSWLTLGLDYTIWAMNPTGYHLTNLLLHAANALLVYRVIVALVPGVGARAALVGALLFAIHPLRVESVAWAAETKDLLCALFFVCACWAHVRRVRRGGSGNLVAVFALLSLMAKPMAVTLPLVLLLLDVWPLARREPLRALVLEKLPLFVLSAASAVITVLAQAYGGAVSSLQQVPLGIRLGLAAVNLERYLSLTFWPTRLSPLYMAEHTPIGWMVASAAALAVVTAAAIASFRRRPPILIGWA